MKKCRKKAPRSIKFNLLTNHHRQKRFSQNERRKADLQKFASEFLIFAPGLSYDLSKFSDNFSVFFFLLRKTKAKSVGKNKKSEAIVCGHEHAEQVCQVFMKIFQAIKKLNSVSRARLNFWRWPILCTTLYRNPIQASNFGGAFDQLFLWNFYALFTEDASLLLLAYGAKK